MKSGGFSEGEGDEIESGEEASVTGVATAMFGVGGTNGTMGLEGAICGAGCEVPGTFTPGWI